MEPNDSNEAKDAAPQKRRFAPQWSLKTMLLLTAVVAAWVPYIRFRGQIAEFQQQIDSMQGMVGELIVEDLSQITVVKLPPMWYEEHRWDIYLPEDDYRIRLATREVKFFGGFPPTVGQSPLSAGQHRIELLQADEEDHWEITVMVDGQPLIEAVESSDWNPRIGSSGVGTPENCTQVSPDKPVTLFGRQFSDGGGTNSNDPMNGVMLWIERIAEDRPEPPVGR